MRRRLFGVAGVVAGLVLVAGCSHGSKSSSSDGATVVGPARSMPAGATAPADAAAGKAAAEAAVAERPFVRTATIALRATNVDDAANRAAAAARAAGGRVDTDIRSGGDATTAHLVLRVPGPRLDSTLQVLDRLGQETSRTVSAEDVAATQADVVARTAATATSVARLRALLAKSATLADLLALEGQLTQREADLESMQAQQRALADQVALASITVDVTGPAPPAPTQRAGGPAGFGHAVAGGWHGVTLGARWVAAIVGYLLPMLGVSAVVALAGGAVLRRRRRVPHAAA